MSRRALTGLTAILLAGLVVPATAQDDVALDPEIVAEPTEADFVDAVDLGATDDGLRARVGRVRVRDGEGDWQPETARQVRDAMVTQGEPVRQCFVQASERHPDVRRALVLIVGTCDAEGCTFTPHHRGDPDAALAECLDDTVGAFREANQALEAELQGMSAQMRVPIGFRVPPTE